MVKKLSILILTATLGGTAWAASTDELRVLFDDAWEARLAGDPVFASRLGDRRFNQAWRDLSLDAFEARHQQRRDFLRRLRQIDPGSLDADDRLNHDLFRRQLENAIDAYEFNGHLMPMSQRGGVQSLNTVADSLSLRTVTDYEDWLARMASVPVIIEQTQALMETGRRSGYVSPRILMERIPAQLNAQLVDTGTDSPFYAAFAALPSGIGEEDRARLQDRAIEIIEDDIVPAYRDFARYFESTYLPASRETIGASQLPNGEAFYEHAARLFTTTSMTPDDIHRLGLDEVARIRAEMQLVIDELEFDGDFDAFLRFLRTDSRFYFDSPQELFDAYLAICKRIDPELVTLFGKLPRMPYGLKPIPDSIAPDTTTAYYSRPAADGSRPGYYYVNLHRPDVRPKYEMEVLSVHEAVPGHHLQIALQMELPNMPAFRRYSGFTAFSEGWGLYSESLGYDLGLYEDPYSHFGALTYEMWRAVRLVVDTGIHYKGWTRAQAIDFFKRNAAKTELDIINEVDRYIARPGQALAYKVGQLKILELRDKAERALGARFDIRDFHDALLGGGALPLDVLETRMNLWLAETLRTRRESTPAAATPAEQTQSP